MFFFFLPRPTRKLESELAKAKHKKRLVIVQEAPKSSDLVGKPLLLDLVARIFDRVADVELIVKPTLTLAEQMALNHVLNRRPDGVARRESPIQRHFEVILPVYGIRVCQ
jgi:hypothetical protein